MSRLISGLLVVLAVINVSASAQSTSFDITAFGARGDGKTMNTSFIQKAIDSCAVVGGGTVRVPAGVYMTGTFRLRSHINFHLENGAVIKGSEDLKDYYLDGKLVGMIFTQNEEDIAITGFGAIDGNGDHFMVLDKAKKVDSAGSAYTRQRARFRELKAGIGDGPLVPKERPYQMIIFSNCRRVTMRDAFIKDSPFWTIHMADCDGVIVSGLQIWGNMLVPNNDGIDFTSCSNVEMSDCDIRTGDDCIVLTGYDHHFDLPGFNHIKHPSENIVVNNCTLQSRSAAIRIGGFDQNPMRNYVFNNITITNSNRGIGIFARDQGSIENLIFTNIVIDTRLQTGDWWGQGDPIHLSAVRLLKDVAPGAIRHVKFENVICRGESGILVHGTKESIIEDVSFNNVSLEMKESPLADIAGGNFDLRPVLDPKLSLFSHDIPGLYARYVKNLRIRDFDLDWDAMKEPYFTHGIKVSNFRDVEITGFRGTASPSNPGMSSILLEDGKGYEVVAKKGALIRRNVKAE